MNSDISELESSDSSEAGLSNLKYGESIALPQTRNRVLTMPPDELQDYIQSLEFEMNERHKGVPVRAESDALLFSTDKNISNLSFQLSEVTTEIENCMRKLSELEDAQREVFVQMTQLFESAETGGSNEAKAAFEELEQLSNTKLKTSENAQAVQDLQEKMKNLMHGSEESTLQEYRALSKNLTELNEDASKESQKLSSQMQMRAKLQEDLTEAQERRVHDRMSFFQKELEYHTSKERLQILQRILDSRKKTSLRKEALMRVKNTRQTEVERRRESSKMRDIKKTKLDEKLASIQANHARLRSEDKTVKKPLVEGNVLRTFETGATRLQGKRETINDLISYCLTLGHEGPDSSQAHLEHHMELFDKFDLVGVEIPLLKSQVEQTVKELRAALIDIEITKRRSSESPTRG